MDCWTRGSNSSASRATPPKPEKVAQSHKLTRQRWNRLRKPPLPPQKKQVAQSHKVKKLKPRPTSRRRTTRARRSSKKRAQRSKSSRRVAPDRWKGLGEPGGSPSYHPSSTGRFEGRREAALTLSRIPAAKRRLSGADGVIQTTTPRR